MYGPQPSSVAPTPELVPVAFLSASLHEPHQSFHSKEYGKAITYVEVKDGSITTVKNDLGLQLEIQNLVGNDKVTTDLTTGTTTLDVNVFGKTPNGSGVHISYPGTVKFSDKIAAILGGTGTFSDIDEYITNAPKFHFDSSAEDKFRWAGNTYFIGKGRFLRDENGLYVQCYFYAVK